MGNSNGVATVLRYEGGDLLPGVAGRRVYTVGVNVPSLDVGKGVTLPRPSRGPRGPVERLARVPLGLDGVDGRRGSNR